MPVTSSSSCSAAPRYPGSSLAVSGEIRAIANAAGLAIDDPAGSDQAAPDPSAPDPTAVPDASGTDAAAPDRTSQTPEWLPAVIGAGALGGFLLLVMIGLALRATRRR